jgi:hypothetical protein
MAGAAIASNANLKMNGYSTYPVAGSTEDRPIGG